jgi:hypothetical protein
LSQRWLLVVIASGESADDGRDARSVLDGGDDDAEGTDRMPHSAITDS